MRGYLAGGGGDAPSERKGRGIRRQRLRVLAFVPGGEAVLSWSSVNRAAQLM